MRGRANTLISSTAGLDEDAFCAFFETFFSASVTFFESFLGVGEEWLPDWLPPDLSSGETAVSPQAVPIEAAAKTANRAHSRFTGSD